MQIFRIPVLSDNYSFLLHDPARSQSIVVDPGSANPVLSLLEGLESELVGIWITHHHHDHVGGNRRLLRRFPQAQVVGGAYDHRRRRIPGQTSVVQEGDRLQFADRPVQVFECPGHTLGHIAYYFPPTTENPELFCGDTLFAGGCGRLLEGTAAQLMRSLTRFRTLPTQTQVWCGHEYTLNNLKFAQTQEPQNLELRQRLQQATDLRKRGKATVPSSLALELATNPFLRCEKETLQQSAGCNQPLELFTMMRTRKDRF